MRNGVNGSVLRSPRRSCSNPFELLWEAQAGEGEVWGARGFFRPVAMPHERDHKGYGECVGVVGLMGFICAGEIQSGSMGTVPLALVLIMTNYFVPILQVYPEIYIPFHLPNLLQSSYNPFQIAL